MALPFLPSHVYKEAQKNNMEGKAGRIVVSWNRFARSLREAFEIYVETKQAEFHAIVDEIPKKLTEISGKIPIRKYIFPTAPPWYVDSVVYGTDGHFVKSASNEAGFQRLDAFIGLHFFQGVYSASPLKFGAFPSLHVAWPAIICVNRPWIGKKFAWFHVLWISWAALYSHHHYGVDALAGIILVFIVNFCMIKIWNPFSSKDYVLDGKASHRSRVNDYAQQV
eukprot:gene209-9844_t